MCLALWEDRPTEINFLDNVSRQALNYFNCNYFLNQLSVKYMLYCPACGA